MTNDQHSNYQLAFIAVKAITFSWVGGYNLYILDDSHFNSNLNSVC